jgi:RNA polymerase sigma-70 factor (sigma-E family)
MSTLVGQMTDRDGFATVYAEHHRRLVRLAWLLTGDADRAEDVVADAFVRVYRRWRRGGIDDVGAYLRTAVVNTARSGFRRQYLERAAAARRDGDDRGVLLHDERAAQHDEVWQAVQRLPRRQREVVVLRFWEDLDVAATAAVLGVSQGTVKSQTARATTRLTELLEDAR